ncbi:MAG: hypothetical protein ACK4SY_05175 [Pyrobaculum sp.]
MGYGKLDPMMRDPYIEDIHVDSPGHVYIWHSRWESLKTDVTLAVEERTMYNVSQSSWGRPSLTPTPF